MAETKPIPVRLGENIISRLDVAAARIGNNRAGVIRYLVDSWLADFEKTGTAALPPDWKKIMAAADNRTRESKLEKIESNSSKASPVSMAARKIRKRNKPAAE